MLHFSLFEKLSYENQMSIKNEKVIDIKRQKYLPKFNDFRFCNLANMKDCVPVNSKVIFFS
jgi:3-methyladenine DNA glycosylase Tag